MLRFFLILCIAVMVPAVSHAETMVSTHAVKKYIPNAELVGKGTMRYLVWNVYDAALYASDGRYENGKPFALSLTYLRPIKGRDIADTTIEEIRRQGFSDEMTLATWHDQMRQVFPDVEVGTVLTGVKTENGFTVILKNNKKIGVFHDAHFAQYFFNIWLAKDTRAPSLRKALLSNVNE